MIKIKTVGDGASCEISGLNTTLELFIEGAACIGALVAAIASDGGAAKARAFAQAIKGILDDEELVNAIIETGADAGRAGTQ